MTRMMMMLIYMRIYNDADDCECVVGEKEQDLL